MNTTSDTADRIKADYNGTFDAIRSDTSRTEQWRKAQIAKAYVEREAKLNELYAAQDESARTAHLALQQKVFGTGSTSADPHASISRRDAGDRAAQLQNETEATELLGRANRSGDEPLARAIAERAFGAQWPNVVNAFLQDRPELVEPAEALWQGINTSTEQLVRDFGARYAGTPTEIAGLGNFEVRRLAQMADNE